MSPPAVGRAFRQLQRLNLKVGRARGDQRSPPPPLGLPALVRRHALLPSWVRLGTTLSACSDRPVALTLQRPLDGVLRYCQHRITNGVAEGLNSKIMTIERKACGFRNAQHFMIAIYFHCGGLALYVR